MGSNFEARAAGATPNTIPTPAETPKDSSTLHQVTVVSIKLLIARAPRDPNITPIMPPPKERTTASIKN